MNNRISSFGFALIGGAAVFVSGIAVDFALLGHERPKIVAFLIANCVAGLIAIITALAFQLRQEERTSASPQRKPPPWPNSTTMCGMPCSH